MPITEQHGFTALRNRLKELFVKVEGPETGTAAVEKVFGETGSLQAMRALVNELETRVAELEKTRPF